MTTTGLQLRSLVKDDNTLEVSLVEVEFPAPGPEEVLVRIDATPINPSDLALLVGPADPAVRRPLVLDAVDDDSPVAEHLGSARAGDRPEEPLEVGGVGDVGDDEVEP